jgi:hypothetical protein
MGRHHPHVIIHYHCYINFPHPFSTYHPISNLTNLLIQTHSLWLFACMFLLRGILLLVLLWVCMYFNIGIVTVLFVHYFILTMCVVDYCSCLWQLHGQEQALYTFQNWPQLYQNELVLVQYKFLWLTFIEKGWKHCTLLSGKYQIPLQIDKTH